MPKDRDQQTPVDPDDRERLERTRGQGTAGTGQDLLPGEPGGPPPRREPAAPDTDADADDAQR